MAYVNPKSVTFWMGVLWILRGVAQMFGVDVPSGSDEVLMGATAIGLRKAIGG